MSVGSIETILHDHLHMSKVSARWVPRLLTPNQKQQRVDSCKELIELESKDIRFFYRIVTMDETWVHHFDPEMKSSSMQWKTPSSPTPKKASLYQILQINSPCCMLDTNFCSKYKPNWFFFLTPWAKFKATHKRRKTKLRKKWVTIPIPFLDFIQRPHYEEANISCRTGRYPNSPEISTAKKN